MARVVSIHPLDPLQAGRAALARGAWEEAKRAFQSVLARQEQPEALEGLGLAAWWLDLGDLVFSTRERAYRLYRARGDRAATARVAVWLAWDSVAFRGETAVASGWLERARRLLHRHPVCPEQAWLAVRDGFFRFAEEDSPTLALKRADDAIRLAKKAKAPDLEMVGSALRGLVLVTTGQVSAGMRQLDEVSAAVLADEISDPVARGLAGCYLVAACARVHDSDRAVQWCQRISEHCRTWGLRPLLAVCRTQYASVCLWRGDWAEAESELVTAADELAASRPAMGAEGWSRLGELRRRQGRFDEAAALFDRAGMHPIASLGLAALALDRGFP